ncbi:MAG: MFS transporter [Candidatus Nanopelagicaceae bacterium]|nr:MFS transporter [Candidatus Nanopelagicaceae bacterium]
MWATELKRAKLAVTLTFITNGLVVGSFVARIPDIKAHLDISNSILGLALLSSSIGVFLALGPSGKFCAKYGSAPIAFRSSLALALATALLGFVFNLAWLCFSLFLFGFSLAFQDVAMNSHAVALEHKSGNRMMSVFHGMFSLGGLIGGAIGGLFSQIKISFQVQTLVVAAFLIFVAFYVKPHWLPADADKHQFIKEERAKKRPTLLWILGFFGFCGALSEGAAGDWGGVLSRETFHASNFVSALPYIAFSATMVIGRFSGDRLAHRFGAPKILSTGGALASAGLALGLVIGGNFGVVLGWFFLGLGLSVVIPLLFSAAGTIAATRFKGQVAPSQAVAIVSGISYFGFIVGPPTMGFLADIFQLRWAMFVPVILVTFLIASARYAKTD